MSKKIMHWADTIADKVIHRKREKDLYVCASGITPSGTVHIGNFREIISVDLVVRALRDRGKKVAVFGSYGWSGEAVRIIESQLNVLKLNVVCESYSARFYPNNEKSEQLIEFGRKFANELI